MTRLVRSLVCVLLAATAAQAQITTSHVKVRVTGRHCDELKTVFLVINGEDFEDRWIKLAPAAEPCSWATDLGDATISTSVAQFSLRADLGRSGCQRAAADERALTANLEFSCCAAGPSRNVRVKVEPPMPVTYTRDVRPFAGDRNPGIPCRERGKFDEGLGSIGNTQFDREKVNLFLGAVAPKPQMPGLLLNDIVVDSGVRVLSRDGVVYRLTVQRAQGKMRSAPTLSSNAISIDIKKLGELKFERAEIEVIK